MKKIVLIICVAFFTFIVSPAWAAEKSSALKNDPYFVSLMQIGIRKSQTKDFKGFINQYTLDRRKAINHERNSTVERNFSIAVKKIRRKEGKEFSQKMKELLTIEQYGRFHSFHKELDKVLESQESDPGGYATESIYTRNTDH